MTAALIALFAAASASAAEVDRAVLDARLAEIAPLRAQRIAEDPPPIPDSAWEQVAAGEIVTGVRPIPGHDARMGWGVGILDVDLKTMWRALNEDIFHRDIMDLDHVEIVKGAMCQDDRRVLMVMPVPIFTDRWWVVQNSVNRKLHAASGGRIWELRWDGVADPEIPGMSDKARDLIDGRVRVVDNVGGWMLVDLDGQHTLAEYHTLTDPGGNVPAGTASGLAARTIGKTMRSLEEYAKTAPARCPVE